MSRPNGIVGQVGNAGDFRYTSALPRSQAQPRAGMPDVATAPAVAPHMEEVRSISHGVPCPKRQCGGDMATKRSACRSACSEGWQGSLASRVNAFRWVVRQSTRLATSPAWRFVGGAGQVPFSCPSIGGEHVPTYGLSDRHPYVAESRSISGLGQVGG